MVAMALPEDAPLPNGRGEWPVPHPEAPGPPSIEALVRALESPSYDFLKACLRRQRPPSPIDVDALPSHPSDEGSVTPQTAPPSPPGPPANGDPSDRPHSSSPTTSPPEAPSSASSWINGDLHDHEAHGNGVPNGPAAPDPFKRPVDPSHPTAPKRRRERGPEYHGFEEKYPERRAAESSPASKVARQVCQRCGVPDDANYTLLCDSCFAAFHMFCVQSGSRRLPAGDWQCDACRQANAPILVHDAYTFFYPSRWYPDSADLFDAGVLHRAMHWILRQRRAAEWRLLKPFTFHQHDGPTVARALADHLVAPPSRKAFAAARWVACLLEFCPLSTEDWGHKMLVFFDRDQGRAVFYDTLGAQASKFPPQSVFSVGRHLMAHLGEALRREDVHSVVGIGPAGLAMGLPGPLQRRSEYVCQSWALLILDALAAGVASVDTLHAFASAGGLYKYRHIPGTDSVREPVVFRTAAQFIVLFHSFHLRRWIQRGDAPRPRFGLRWGALTDAAFPAVFGSSRTAVAASYARLFPWAPAEPFSVDDAGPAHDPLDALSAFLRTQLPPAPADPSASTPPDLPPLSSDLLAAPATDPGSSAGPLAP